MVIINGYYDGYYEWLMMVIMNGYYDGYYDG